RGRGMDCGTRQESWLANRVDPCGQPRVGNRPPDHAWRSARKCQFRTGPTSSWQIVFPSPYCPDTWFIERHRVERARTPTAEPFTPAPLVLLNYLFAPRAEGGNKDRHNAGRRPKSLYRQFGGGLRVRLHTSGLWERHHPADYGTALPRNCWLPHQR